jgi:hypothetical protein
MISHVACDTGQRQPAGIWNSLDVRLISLEADASSGSNNFRSLFT